MQMMDAACGFHRIFSDGCVDHTHWSRPGYRFADTNDADRIAANDAYEADAYAFVERRWRNKRVLTPEKSDAAPPRAPTLDQLQAQAQQGVGAAQRTICATLGEPARRHEQWQQK